MNLGILEVLLIVFIVLKCAGLVAWSWPVVLIPLWIILILVFLIIMVR